MTKRKEGNTDGSNLGQRKKLRLEEGNINDLALACEKGDTETVKLLLDHENIEVNKLASTYKTPLYIACEKGDTETVKLLLDHENIEVNKPNLVSHKTPLHIACQNIHPDKDRYIEIAKLLIGKKANVNASCEDGMTPLHAACYQGNNKAAELLINHGALVEYADNKGRTPIFFASTQGNSESVMILLENNASPNIAQKGVVSHGPLFTIARYGLHLTSGHLKAVRALLEKEADVKEEHSWVDGSSKVVRRDIVTFCMEQFPLHKQNSHYVSLTAILLNSLLEGTDMDDENPLKELVSDELTDDTIKECIKEICLSKDPLSATIASYLCYLEGYQDFMRDFLSKNVKSIKTPQMAMFLLNAFPGNVSISREIPTHLNEELDEIKKEISAINEGDLRAELLKYDLYEKERFDDFAIGISQHIYQTLKGDPEINICESEALAIATESCLFLKSKKEEIITKREIEFHRPYLKEKAKEAAAFMQSQFAMNNIKDRPINTIITSLVNPKEYEFENKIFALTAIEPELLLRMNKDPYPEALEDRPTAIVKASEILEKSLEKSVLSAINLVNVDFAKMIRKEFHELPVTKGPVKEKDGVSSEIGAAPSSSPKNTEAKKTETKKDASLFL